MCLFNRRKSKSQTRKSNFKEKLQERDKQYEKLERHVKNLEQQKSEELQQLQQLEIISQSLQNNLEVIDLDKIEKNNNKAPVEIKIPSIDKNDEQKNLNINKPTILFLNNKEINNSFERSSFSFNEKKNVEKSKLYPDIQVVVGLDFGTISSKFSIDSVTGEINYSLQQKDTILEYYDNEYNKVMINNLKPKLPIEYKKAIADYFKEIGKFAEYSEKDKEIMRECIRNAKLIKNKSSEKLQFITESEAAAIYCMKNELQKYNLLSLGKTFIIVDCGGSTTDITTYKLVENNPLQLGEVTDLIRDFCGCTFIDEEIIKLLHENFGTSTINILKENHSGQYRNTVLKFSQHVKEFFAGDNTEFSYTLDIEEKVPDLPQYVSNEVKEIMEENNWLIDIKYNDIKKMVDF
ncbi:hypothetical protein RclHR1_19660002 [Rhizophagus clarus]|uniref:Uncharacterized protein n=1 Tax=Rhizophagus clarus TaxID=94130 RepID=A0A2Z6RI85_9GLOM|nr:hypothetical protein RclHR1_19660002 [Rhizophagus clarus]